METGRIHKKYAIVTLTKEDIELLLWEVDEDLQIHKSLEAILVLMENSK